MGDICLGSCPETVFPKKYSFDLGVTEELPLPRGVRELTQNFFWYFVLAPIRFRKIWKIFVQIKLLQSKSFTVTLVNFFEIFCEANNHNVGT